MVPLSDKDYHMNVHAKDFRTRLRGHVEKVAEDLRAGSSEHKRDDEEDKNHFLRMALRFTISGLVKCGMMSVSDDDVDSLHMILFDPEPIPSPPLDSPPKSHLFYKPVESFLKARGMAPSPAFVGCIALMMYAEFIRERHIRRSLGNLLAQKEAVT